MSVLQTSVEISCRRCNYNVQLTISEFSYLMYYANNYFEVHSEGVLQAGLKCLSWLPQLPKRVSVVPSLWPGLWINCIDLSFSRALGSDPKSHSAGGGKETSPGGSRTLGSRSFGCSAGQGGAGETNYGPDEEPGTAGKTQSFWGWDIQACYCALWVRQSLVLQEKTVQWSTRPCDSIVMALVFIMSNLLFALNFLCSLYYSGV